MELKLGYYRDVTVNLGLLIVPYGIETGETRKGFPLGFRF